MSVFVILLLFASASLATARRAPRGASARALTVHTNALLRHKCLPIHKRWPRNWQQARYWHLKAHRARRGSCAPWPAWWRAQAECIHRHESIDWHNNGHHEGGFQFNNGTWLAHGGGRFAAHAYQASPFQQLLVAFWTWRDDGRSWRREWTTAGMCGLA